MGNRGMILMVSIQPRVVAAAFRLRHSMQAEACRYNIPHPREVLFAM